MTKENRQMFSTRLAPRTIQLLDELSYQYDLGKGQLLDELVLMFKFMIYDIEHNETDDIIDEFKHVYRRLQD